MTQKDKIMKKKEKEWVGIGIGSGKFGEEELRKDIQKQREGRSIFNAPPPKIVEEDYDSEGVIYADE